MPNDDASQTNLDKERRVLIAMRKTLASVVKDVTPSEDLPESPLSIESVENIKHCFGLISAREQEIAQLMGKNITEKPRFIDEPDEKVINFISTKREH